MIAVLWSIMQHAKKCRGQYGTKSATPLKKRHSNHKEEIKRKYDGGLVIMVGRGSTGISS